MSTSGTTAPLRGTTVDAHGTTVNPGAVLPEPQKQSVNYGRKTEEAPRKEGIKGDMYVMIPPKPFQRGPLLIVRLSYDSNPPKRNVEKTPSSSVFEGHPIVLCLAEKSLESSWHTISPQMHCHQSPKHLGINMTLQSPPFWWIDDKTGFAQRK